LLQEPSSSRSSSREQGRQVGLQRPGEAGAAAGSGMNDNSFGTLLRRHFEPLMLSAQVLADLLVVLFACWLGYSMGVGLGGIPVEDHALSIYQELSALIAAVCLVTFHFFGMYNPTKSLLNMEEYKSIAKSTVVSFLVFFTLIIFLRTTSPEGKEGSLYDLLLPLHKLIDLDVEPDTVSRLALLLTFGLILILTTASRFASFKLIQMLHQRGIGNRNVLIYGAGEIGRHLQRKFQLVPTLGLNLIGFVDDDKANVGKMLGRSKVLGTYAELSHLIGLHKVSEVFVAAPEEASEQRVMEVLTELDHMGVSYRVVPRFYNLMSFDVRIESLDSIPLITRADRSQGLLGRIAKRGLDIVVSLVLLLLSAPLWLIVSILIKRESPGPVLFVQPRVGRDGKLFKMCKFRTMHQHLSGDAPAPNSPYDPRITQIGRWLRRYSLDELPQLLNVLTGEMSMVGPRPEMSFIVDKYGAMERERLRAKPGITGLWQISYARQMAIHDHLDYDLYYIEHQSLLLDVVILVLTSFAIVKGTGAY
jgi:exopolysaccharide biosynthesis polyprenyl glycosylphosphotransferase